MGILSGLSHLLGSGPPPDDDLRQAIDRAVGVVDPGLKVVPDYRRRLAPAVDQALRHCATVAAGIPGPVEVGAGAFATDPLVHALFAAPGDIADMLGKSREVRDFFADPENAGQEEFYALLGMRQRQKAVTGMALNGDVVQHGVPQRLLYFADHTLGELGGGHELTRRRLQMAAFDGLAQGFARCLDDLRRERQEARSAWQLERASVGERRQELEERQRNAIASLAPENLLDAFAGWLSTPEQRLYLKPTEVTVDRMGVISPSPRTGEGYSTLRFPELVARDRRQWIVLVARINRREALAALQRQQQANRYLLI